MLLYCYCETNAQKYHGVIVLTATRMFVDHIY